MEALDSIKDVEKVLSPWHERLRNKERMIGLKEQTRVVLRARTAMT